MRKVLLISLAFSAAVPLFVGATPPGLALGAGTNFGLHPGIVAKLPGSPTFVEIFYVIPGQNDGVEIRAYSYLLDMPLGNLFSINVSPVFEFGSWPLFIPTDTSGGYVGAGLRLGVSIWPLRTLEVALSIGFEPVLSVSSSPAVSGSATVSGGYSVPMEATVRYYFGE
jgi:hypothetical protein